MARVAQQCLSVARRGSTCVFFFRKRNVVFWWRDGCDNGFDGRLVRSPTKPLSHP